MARDEGVCAMELAWAPCPATSLQERYHSHAYAEMSEPGMCMLVPSWVCTCISEFASALSRYPLVFPPPVLFDHVKIKNAILPNTETQDEGGQTGHQGQRDRERDMLSLCDGNTLASVCS